MPHFHWCSSYGVVELIGSLIVNSQAIVAKDPCYLRTPGGVCASVCVCSCARVMRWVTSNHIRRTFIIQLTSPSGHYHYRM